METDIIKSVELHKVAPTKTDIDLLATNIVDTVEQKNIDPLLALATLSGLEAAVKRAKEQVSASFALPAAQDYAARHGEKTFTLFGAEFQLKMQGVKTYYDWYEDEKGKRHENRTWQRQAARADYETKELKAIEAELKIYNKCRKIGSEGLSVVLSK